MRIRYSLNEDETGADGRRGGSFDDIDQEGSGREDPTGRYDDDGDVRPDDDPVNRDEGHGRDRPSADAGQDGGDAGDGDKPDLDHIDDSYSGAQWGGAGASAGAAGKGVGDAAAEGAASEGMQNLSVEGMQHGMGAGGMGTFAGTVGAAAAGAVRVIASVLHVSPHVATVIATVMALAVPVAGGVAVGAGFMANNHDEQVFWIDEDKCEDYVKAASKSLKNADGSRTEIPETIQAGGEGGGQTYRVGYMATWENLAHSIGFGGSTPNAKLVEFYDKYGGYTSQNRFERIKDMNDLFIVALGQGPFRAEGADELNIGDLVTIEFDDGTSINAIIGDHKGRFGVSDKYDKSCWGDIHTSAGGDRTCGWGHVYDPEIAVLEFWGLDSSGNPMSGNLQAETGGSMQRCTAITVHGMCQEFAEFAGLTSSGAMVSAKNLQANSNKKASEAIEECGMSEKKDTEASDFASALVLSSYSQKVSWDGGAHPGTKTYDAVWTALHLEAIQYRSCCATVGLAANWAGIANFPMGGPAEQGDAAEAGIASGEWERLKGKNGEDHIPEGMPLADAVDYFGMKPGTILATDDETHILAYVGEEAVKAGYEKLKGTDADVGEPEPGAAFVSGSAGVSGAASTRDSDPGNGRPSGIHAAGGETAHSYRVYHYIGSYPKASETRSAGNFQSIGKGGSNSNTAGTDCDCGDPCEDEFGADAKSTNSMKTASSKSSKSGSSGSGIKTDKLGEGAKKMANYLKKKMNFSNAQIAGIIANSLFESYGVWEKEGDPIDVRYDNFGPVAGSSLWGGGCFGFVRGGCFDMPDGGLEALAQQMGKSYEDPEAQLEYLKRFWDQSWGGGTNIGDWVARYGGSLAGDLGPYMSMTASKDSFLAEKDSALCALIFQCGWERGPATADIRIKQRMDCAKYIEKLLGKDVKECEGKKKKASGLHIIIEVGHLAFGRPYQMTGNELRPPFDKPTLDCSGFVQWCYWHAMQIIAGSGACSSMASAGEAQTDNENENMGRFERVERYEDLVEGDILLHIQPGGDGGGGDHAMIFMSDNGDGTTHIMHSTSGSGGSGPQESDYELQSGGLVANYCFHLREEYQKADPTPECAEALRAKGISW